MLRTAFLALLLTGINAPALAQPTTETVPLLREIKNWVIGCDNLRNCHALSAPSGVDEEDASSLTLHIWHQAGPEGYLRLRVDHRGEALDGFSRGLSQGRGADASQQQGQECGA